jgi:hypothetical protein
VQRSDEPLHRALEFGQQLVVRLLAVTSRVHHAPSQVPLENEQSSPVSKVSQLSQAFHDLHGWSTPVEELLRLHQSGTNLCEERCNLDLLESGIWLQCGRPAPESVTFALKGAI